MAKNPENLYHELQSATAAAREAGEADSAYYCRLCEAVAKLDDEAFGRLSPEARDWTNRATTLINEGKLEELPPLSGLPGDETAAAETAAVPEAAAPEATTTPAADAKKGGRRKPPTTLTEETEVSKATKTSKKATKPAAAANGEAKHFQVKALDKVKRGDVLKFVQKAVELKRFTREELAESMKRSMDAARANRYFYWCKSNGVFVSVK